VNVPAVGVGSRQCTDVVAALDDGVAELAKLLGSIGVDTGALPVRSRAEDIVEQLG
jgi:hypothetical protein